MVAILIGAFVGAAFIVQKDTMYPLVIALIVTVMVTATTWLLGVSDPAWVHGTSAN